MNSQNQDEIYLTLVKIWRQSYRSKKIISIPLKENFISNIRKLGSYIRIQLEKASDRLIQEIFSKSIQNIHFMVKDLLDTRLDKILARCRSQKKIDENLLLPEEIEFYRGMYTSFRGYAASKTMILDELLPSSSQNRNNSPPTINPPFQEVPRAELSPGEQSSVQTSSQSPNISEGIPEEFPYDQYADEFSSEEDIPPPEILEEMEKEMMDENNLSITQITPKSVSHMNYIPVRILSEIAPLVGADLEIYGPFSQEDLISLPKQNADILIADHLACMVEI